MDPRNGVEATPERQTMLKDSGTKESFATGSVRDKQRGKGALHLVPTWVIWLVSRVYEEGAIKYEARNWEKGQPLSQYIKSAENHLAKLKMGLRDEPHASQVVWNMLAYIFTAVLIKLGVRPGSLNDMPNQIHCIPGTLAEPLSDAEYESMNTFFQGSYDIKLSEEKDRVDGDIPESSLKSQQRHAIVERLKEHIKPANECFLGTCDQCPKKS